MNIRPRPIKNFLATDCDCRHQKASERDYDCECRYDNAPDPHITEMPEPPSHWLDEVLS